MTTGLHDNEVIARVLNGDTAAYALLVEQYKGYVFTLVLRFTENREDAEELSQDIFIKAFRALATFRGESKFSTWLYTIVNTICLSHLRKRKQAFRSLDDERMQAAVAQEDSGMSANQVETKSRHAMVNRAISLLGPEDAQILTLFYKAEQNLEEMAEILGIATNAAKVRLHRARGRLKIQLEKHYAPELRDLQ